jgi:hypothetical protein
MDSRRNTTFTKLNRLVYYPTGSYGTFIQWLCNTKTILGSQDLPFQTDGNSHKYVLSDNYCLLISPEGEQQFTTTQHATVASCIWPLDHNGKVYNQHGQPDFYHHISQQHLKFFADNNVQILVIHPTDTSKIWWWHNNCKKVFYTPSMFDKKIKKQYSDLPWLTTTDPVQRAQVQMNYYAGRVWYNELLQQFQCADAYQLSPAQLRTVMAHAIHNETFDYLSHWSQLPAQFPNIKFVSLDQLRDHTQDTIQDIFKYFAVESELPLDFVIDQWTALQTTRHRDREHHDIVNCIVNGQACDWSDLNFDLFDEVYLLWVLKFQHGLDLKTDAIEKLPTNTQGLLELAN